MNTSQGFTLVETMVAITILTVAIVGPYHAVQVALNVSYVARDELIASALAQEGLEYVHSVRDSNFAYNTANPSTPGSWIYGFDGTSRAGVAGKNCIAQACTLDVAQSSVVSAVAQCSGTCPALNLSSGNLYTQASGAGYTATRFTRSVRVTTINVHEVKVSSVVTWKTLGVTYTITLNDYLQDWL